MNGIYLVDTDVLIDYLCGRREAVAFVDRNVDRIVLSPIVVAELYAGAKEDEREELDQFVSLFPIIPINGDIAKAAGLLKRDFGRSHGVGLSDAVLAATVQAEGARLKTLSVKHYPMLKGLKPAYVKS